MDILVFDDTPKQQHAAAVLLSDHNLTVVGTYDDAQKAIRTTHFDVVMTDLMVPASSQKLGPRAVGLVGQEMPLGTMIVLLALSYGTKMVALVTDANHHDHPASAALDAFFGEGFPVGDAKVICLNSGIFTTLPREPDVSVKDWGKVLELLKLPAKIREVRAETKRDMSSCI